jgi:hypothetical protein
MIPYELLQDLNRLACTSKNKKIEDLFLKLAQGQEDNFYEWMDKNRNNRVLKGSLDDTTVLDALAYAYENVNSQSTEGLVAFLANNKPEYIPIYGSFFRIHEAGNFSEILTPIVTWLTRLSRARSESGDNSVRKDLTRIVQQYNMFKEREFGKTFDAHPSTIKAPPKKTKKQRDMDHTRFLFKALTKEIMDAISGEEDLASTYEVVSGGNLPSVDRIVKSFPHLPYAGPNFKKIPRMAASYLSKSNKNVVDAFNWLRGEMLKNLDFPNKPYINLNNYEEEEEEEEEDFSLFLDDSYMPENKKTRKQMKPVDYNPLYTAQRSYIFMSSMILSHLFERTR